MARFRATIQETRGGRVSRLGHRELRATVNGWKNHRMSGGDEQGGGWGGWGAPGRGAGVPHGREQRGRGGARCLMAHGRSDRAAEPRQRRHGKHLGIVGWGGALVRRRMRLIECVVGHLFYWPVGEVVWWCQAGNGLHAKTGGGDRLRWIRKAEARRLIAERRKSCGTHPNIRPAIWDQTCPRCTSRIPAYGAP